jgi:hypothetical protein
MFYGFFETAVTYVKGYISNMVRYTPYKDKIEKPLYLAIEHSVFFLGGYLTFWDRDWLYDLSKMWDYEFEWSIYIYYYLYFVRYVVQILHMEKTDKDYNVFLTHHICTLLLLLISVYRFTHVGVIIALSHDISDIFLNTGKVANKIFEVTKDTRHNMISDLLLSFFVVSWVPTRIVLNYNILSEIYTHKNLTLGVYLYDCWIDEQLAFLFLMLNFGLQLFWQVLIIRFVYNICVGVKPKDEKGVEYQM